jgi:hypothetical protein
MIEQQNWLQDDGSESSEVDVHKCRACGDEFRTSNTLKIHATACNNKHDAKKVRHVQAVPAKTDRHVRDPSVGAAKKAADAIFPAKKVTEAQQKQNSFPAKIFQQKIAAGKEPKSPAKKVSAAKPSRLSSSSSSSSDEDAQVNHDLLQGDQGDDVYQLVQNWIGPFLGHFWAIFSHKLMWSP